MVMKHLMCKRLMSKQPNQHNRIIDKQDSKQWYKYDVIINRVFNKKYDN